jgi:hypothetical protein
MTNKRGIASSDKLLRGLRRTFSHKQQATELRVSPASSVSHHCRRFLIFHILKVFKTPLLTNLRGSRNLEMWVGIQQMQELVIDVVTMLYLHGCQHPYKICVGTWSTSVSLNPPHCCTISTLQFWSWVSKIYGHIRFSVQMPMVNDVMLGYAYGLRIKCEK